MGWYGHSIGNYKIVIHDSVFDYVKRSKPEDYYLNYKIEVEFIINGEEEHIEFPLLTFGKLNKLKKYYEFELTIWEDNILTKMLFDLLKERSLLPIFGKIYCAKYTHDQNWYFYLTSGIGDETIILQNSGHIKHSVNSIEDYNWIYDHGLDFKPHL